MIRVAIFSDIHGKILLPFKLVNLYQNIAHEKIDFILQCGDIGCFPDIKNLDKATLKHAKHDRDELGFCDDFTKINTDIKKFLDKLNVNMICVRGNHEDHDYLDILEQQSEKSSFCIDVYKRVFVCKSALKQEFIKDDESLSFVGIGRIGDAKQRNDKQFIQKYEQQNINKLIKSKDMFDVLITHDKSSESKRGYGSQEIRKVLDNVLFSYHFYGHTGEPFNDEMDSNGITKSIKIQELEWSESGILKYGSMLILEKQNSQMNLKIVPQSITNRINKFSWKQTII